MVETAVSWEDTLAGWSPEIQPRISLLSTRPPTNLECHSQGQGSQCD